MKTVSANNVKVINTVISEAVKIRVAAYVRVSSSNQDQIHSFAAQQSYYQRLMAEKTDSVFAGIYADDEGFTGLKADIRPAFQRMLLDCRLGKINRILTKSVSRFSRNVADLLSVIRELKALNVSVYFEKENIDTERLSSELMLMVFSGVAQAESLAVSSNMQMGCRMRMKNGTYKQSVPTYGYEIRDGNWIINEKEASIVKRIFSSYLSGVGMRAIADELTHEGILSSNGKLKWHRTIVGFILKNERYIGDQLLQKTYTTSTLPLKEKKNRGERDMYYIENAHSAIISKEDFYAVQALIKKRAPEKSKLRRYENTYDGKLICKACGRHFVRKARGDKLYWICGSNNRYSNCDVGQISEQSIHEAFYKLYYKLKHFREVILSRMLEDLKSLKLVMLKKNGKTALIDKKIKSLLEQNRVLNELRVKGTIDSAIFIAQRNDVNHRLEKLKKEKTLIQIEVEKDDAIGATKAIIRSLEDAPENINAFDEHLFKALVKQVIVHRENSVTFKLINGLECHEHIVRGV